MIIPINYIIKYLIYIGLLYLIIKYIPNNKLCNKDIFILITCIFICILVYDFSLQYLSNFSMCENNTLYENLTNSNTYDYSESFSQTMFKQSDPPLINTNYDMCKLICDSSNKCTSFAITNNSDGTNTCYISQIPLDDKQNHINNHTIHGDLAPLTTIYKKGKQIVIPITSPPATLPPIILPSFYTTTDTTPPTQLYQPLTQPLTQPPTQPPTQLYQPQPYQPQQSQTTQILQPSQTPQPLQTQQQSQTLISETSQPQITTNYKGNENTHGNKLYNQKSKESNLLYKPLDNQEFNKNYEQEINKLKMQLSILNTNPNALNNSVIITNYYNKLINDLLQKNVLTATDVSNIKLKLDTKLLTIQDVISSLEKLNEKNSSYQNNDNTKNYNIKNELPNDFYTPIGDKIANNFDNAYSILDTSKWMVPMPRPPVCINNSPCKVCPVSESIGADLQQWDNIKSIS